MIRKLRLFNWLCYRGEHVLELQPKAYAIVARSELDPERSNWLGKTAIPDAVDFALHGRHRWRTEDEWITRGEGAGEVELVLDDGTRILRTRARGRRTTLHYWSPGSGKAALQSEAQELVSQRLGVGQEDFLVTSYLRQREMARLVLARPKERMEMVSAWVGLAPVERCEARAASEAADLQFKVSDLEGKLEGIASMKKEIVGDLVTRERLQEIHDGHVDVLSKRRAQLDEVDERLRNNDCLHGARVFMREYERRRDAAEQLYEERCAVDDEALASKANDARLQARAAEAEQIAIEKDGFNAKRVADGAFDGECPVAGIQCPARHQINGDRVAARRRYEEHEDRYKKHLIVVGSGLRAEAAADQDLTDVKRADDRLRAERAWIAEHQDRYAEAQDLPEAQDPEVLRLRRMDALRRLEETQASERGTAQRLSKLADLDELASKAQAALDQLRGRAATARECAVVFGRNGAQRRVAEGALREIEGEANALLEAMGIDLRTQLVWGREGSGLASACAECGAPFPKTATAKVCQRCKAPRGANLVSKLEVELSERSGAAEDLAGACIQLGASLWLRRERGSSWSVGMIDEPFGQLDAYNRRALGAHLARAITQRGLFEQSFIIAHSADVLNALPGRILVTACAGGSRVEVA